MEPKSCRSRLDSKRIDLLDRLEEGDGENTCCEAEELAADHGRSGGACVWLDGGRWGRDGSIAAGGDLWLPVTDLGDWGASGDLDLSVANLGDWGASGRLNLPVADLGDWSTSWGLRLSVGDLGDGRARSGLYLAVGDLLDWSTGRGLWLSIGDLGDRSTSGRLWLTVADLHDRRTSGALDLAIRDLSDWVASGCLWLSIANLRDWRASYLTVSLLRLDAGGSWLTIRLFACGGNSAAVDDLEVDRAALSSAVLIVKVEETTAQALLENSIWTENKSAVAADSPTRGVDGTSLHWVVKLELVVGGDVTDAVLVVLEDAILESKGQSLGLSLGERSLGGGGDVDGLDVEGSAVAWRAAGGSGLSWGLGNWGGRSERRKGDGSERVTHYCCSERGGRINTSGSICNEAGPG